MSNIVTFETEDAVFCFNIENIIDSLRVVFHSEVNDNDDAPLSHARAWRRFSDEAKNNRITAITVALTDISLDEVRFRNREACRINDDVLNLYDLFIVLHEHRSARLVHVLSHYADSITELNSDYITSEELLKTFAHFITEDILDIEADLYARGQEKTTSVEASDKHAKDLFFKTIDPAIARCKCECGSDDKVVCAAKKARKRIADEISPVEDFKAFMKAQYEKHKDKVDEIVDAYDYITNDVAGTRELDTDDPVNHPKHYKASNGLEAIDCIEAFTEDLPGDIGYLIGNAMKYLCRFDKKGKPDEDLRKAKWYIERAIKSIESRKM